MGNQLSVGHLVASLSKMAQWAHLPPSEVPTCLSGKVHRKKGNLGPEHTGQQDLTATGAHTQLAESLLQGIVSHPWDLPITLTSETFCFHQASVLMADHPCCLQTFKRYNNNLKASCSLQEERKEPTWTFGINMSTSF